MLFKWGKQSHIYTKCIPQDILPWNTMAVTIFLFTYKINMFNLSQFDRGCWPNGSTFDCRSRGPWFKS